MVLAQGLTPDFHGLLIKWLRGRVVAHRLVQHRQVVEAGREVRMVLAQMFAGQLTGFDREANRLVVVALLIEFHHLTAQLDKLVLIRLRHWVRPVIRP